MFKKIISLLEQILEQQKRTNQLLEKLVPKNVDLLINIDSEKLTNSIEKNTSKQIKGI